MFPPTPKPPPEMKCPPERSGFLGVDSMFMDKQNLCLRAGRPFYLEAKHDFRLCTQQLVQCPRDLQVDIYVHQGDWVVVTRRFPGLVYVYYDRTPLARYSHDYEQGYADVNLLQAPQPRH